MIVLLTSALAITAVVRGGASVFQPQPTASPAAAALSGQMDVQRLLDLAAQKLRLNLEYDAATIKGAATLRLNEAVSDDELWLLVNRVLVARGFTTVKMPGERAYSVVKLAEAGALAAVGEPGGVATGVAPGFVLVTVRAHYRPNKELVDAFSKVLSKPSGSAQPLGDSGLILIADLSPRVEQALALLKLLDVPAAPATLKELPAQHLAAPALATLVAQVSAKRELITGEKIPGEVLAAPSGSALILVCPPERESYWTNLIASLDQREAVLTRSYSPRTFSTKEVATLIEQTVKDTPGLPPDDRWRLVPDDLTGTVIITATATQHEAISALVERLNSAPSTAPRPVRSFVLKNRSVKEIQGVLEQLVSAGVLAAIEPGSEGSGQGPGTSTGLAPWPAATVSPPSSSTLTGAAPAATPQHPQTHSSGLHDPAQAHQGHNAPVVFTADEGTSTLIAMGEPRLLAQIEQLIQSLDVRQPQVMLEVLIVSLSESQSLDLGVELEKLTTSGDLKIRLSSLFGLGTRGPTGDRIAGDGSGFTGVVLSPGDFSVIVHALENLNHGRSVSMPRVLVSNNQQGMIDSTLDQPFASTNASNTVTTTSFGGSQQAGTQVSIKPQIASGDHLLLDYSVSLSAFVGGAASPNLPPPKQQNHIQSSASIPDGYTVAVGGIELTSEGKATNQIPFLGNIPIIGEAFKNRNNTTSRSRFFVFIRANVLRQTGFEDLKYLSDQDVAKAGVDEGWPVLEPRVIK